MIPFGRSGALAVAGLLLWGGAALAAPFSITTTGTITSGSDPGNLLGAGGGLVGSAYMLTVDYAGLGSSYYTDGSGQTALDFGDAIPGSITVTVGQTTMTTALMANEAPSLTEDRSDLLASTSGNDSAGNFAYASQNISSSNDFVPFADLQTAFSYTLTGADSGTDSYSFSNAGNTLTASFSGTPTSVVFAVAQAVPEPATWSAVAAGLIGLALVGRRRAV